MRNVASILSNLSVEYLPIGRIRPRAPFVVTTVTSLAVESMKTEGAPGAPPRHDVRSCANAEPEN